MTLFYNICSILVGIILIIFGVFTLIKKNKILFAVLSFVHAALFIAFGILGFFVVDTEYEPITILAMLAFTITYIICILTLYKKEPKKQNKEDIKKKEEPKEIVEENEKSAE